MKSNRINVVFDLDNTLISSLSPNECTEEFMRKNKLDYITMYKDDKDHSEGYYFNVFIRPGIQPFLDYVFSNFDVSVWTAASREYASFIVNNVLLKKSNRELKMFLCDDNCEQSMEIYNKKTPKDLRYIFHFPTYKETNTVIVDDLSDVRNANPRNTIPAPYFDAKKNEEAVEDRFLKELIFKLEKLKGRNSIQDIVNKYREEFEEKNK